LAKKSNANGVFAKRPKPNQVIEPMLVFLHGKRIEAKRKTAQVSID
jgi:hypothetical protein